MLGARHGQRRVTTGVAQQPRVDRRRMVEQHLPLADRLARRYDYTSEPLDDLTQVARIGLMKAVERWDPDRGTAFSTFAVPTILGELRRYFRDNTWTVKPPRDLQELFLNVKKVREALSQELGREATIPDVAQHLGRTPEELVEAAHAGELHSPLSIDAPLHETEDEGIRWGDRVADPRRELAHAEDGVTLRQLGALLEDRDWEVVRLRFQEDLMQREIGDRVGCSQMHVSRILRDALTRLREAAYEENVVFD
ncbi:MAG TPA: SigB/SigF/SigG family RNA polymerase sigma factor [Solirubrobacteraceae bacterium]|nr:SigB/SigF/SigG family RNA polymerase sigma factor [Solirubrobacteraceae bacterium]